MVNPNINSFGQTPIDGELDLTAAGGNVFSARVSNNIGSGVTLIAGQAVKVDTATPGTSQDGVFPVLPLASNSDPLFGFVKYSIKDAAFAVNQRLEVATTDCVMFKTANGAINRMSAVEYDTSTNDVIAWAGVNPIAGFAFDAAINVGDLIRVRISSPQTSASNTSQSQKVVSVTATLAQINAGLILIPGITGKKITVTNYTARVTGAFATGTAVLLESTNVSPVLVTTLAEAGLTNGAVLTPASGNTTLGAGFAAPMGSGDGLQVANSGTAQTGGTNIAFTITYIQA